MSMKHLVMFLLLSLSSFAALAVPSVRDVETKIANGEYSEAKTLLKQVLKEQPDSYVANRYMLEILNLEYARTLKPSVEYKLYEDELARIVNKKAERERLVAEAQAAESRAKVTRILFSMLGVVLFAGFIFFIFTVIFPRVIAYRNEKEAARLEAIRLKKWKADTLPDLIDLNSIMSNLSQEAIAALRPHQRELLEGLRLDNLDAMTCLQNDDYNEELIDRHLINAYEFLTRHKLVEE